MMIGFLGIGPLYWSVQVCLVGPMCGSLRWLSGEPLLCTRP